MRSDEILKCFHLLMKRKNQLKHSGSYEAKAYKEQAKLLKEHYEFALSYEKQTNQ